MQFPDMKTIHKPAEIGEAKIDYRTVSKHEAVMSAWGGWLSYCPPGTYARLRVGGQVVMSDTPMEHSTNWNFAHKVNGDVLIAGLGLGMIVFPALVHERVKSITVIEKSADVIALVWPKVKKRNERKIPVNVIHCDIHEWKPERSLKWDTIYFDIWPNICGDNLEEIAKLHHRFKVFKNRANPQAWMGSWCQDELRAEKRR